MSMTRRSVSALGWVPLSIALLLASTTARAADAAYIYLADQPAAGGAYALFVGVGATVQTVVLCKNGAIANCNTQTQGALSAHYVTNKNGRRIFQTDNAVSLEDGAKYAVVGLNADGAALEYQMIRFDKVTTTNTSSNNTGGSTGDGATSGDQVKLQDMAFTIPEGWKVQQDAAARGTLILGLTKGNDYMRIYVRQGTGPDMQRTFANGAAITKTVYTQQLGGNTWKRMGTRMAPASNVRYISAFCTEKNGYSYWGYAASITSGGAIPAAQALLSSAQ